MAKKSEQLTLDELRDKSVKSKSKLSFGKEMGGYNKKQVNEYIDSLTENLQNAEESFNNRLEEYAAMITMLKQERDQYGEMYNLCKNSKIEMANQLDELKRENEELNRLLSKQSTDQSPVQTEALISNLHETSLDSQQRLEEYLSYEQESTELKAQLDQLKAMVRDLNRELETYAKEKLSDYDPENFNKEKTPVTNDVLKQQYDDILLERSALLTEKHRLAEENKRLSDTVVVLNEQLKRAADKCETRIRESMTVYKSSAEEFFINHQNTMIQLAENLKHSMNLVATGDEQLSEFKKTLIPESLIEGGND